MPHPFQTILFPQNFLHGLSFGQLVHQLVQVADFLHQRFFNGLHLYPADGSSDQPPIGVGRWSILEEIPVGDVTLHPGNVPDTLPGRLGARDLETRGR